MRQKRLFFIITISLLCVVFSYGQNSIDLQNGQTYSITNSIIYDDGGETGNMENLYTSSVLKAHSGYIKLYFNYIEIPSGATLKIFNGLDTSELIGVYNGTYKPANVIGKAFTIVYDPGQSVGTNRGWEGIVQTVYSGATEKVTLPESDCVGAIPLCGNSTVNTSANQYENTGAVNDDSGSCYSGTGSGGSVWYSFSPQSNGNLDFLISPAGSTDYDFVLWNITNGCENKTQVSCNFSGTTGATGLNSTGTTNSQDASGTTINQLAVVNTTQVYAICINYYSGTNAGFTLTFQNNPADVAIVDNTPPTIDNAYTNNCASASTFTINFSEYIDCTTLQASDFSIPGYTVALTSTNCNGGKTNSVVVTVSPAMVPGSYTMTVNNMTDMCGNPLNSTYNINTTVVPTANAGSDAIGCTTSGIFGTTNYSTVNLTGSGGTSYLWNTGQSTANISVTPTSTTTYTLTAIEGSCSSTDQVIVTVAASPTPNLGPDQTVCAGFPVTLTASGGISYQWQSTTSTIFGSPTGWTNISGATSSTYTASPGSTIYYRVLVTNAAGCVGSDWIKVTIGSGTFGITAPTFICEGSSATLSLPSSMTLYTWSTGGSPVGTANTALVVSPSTTTTYTATSTTPGCTGSASITVPVHPTMNFAANANPTTACAGVPVDLSATAPSTTTTTVTENFESSNGFTLVNGTYNKWYNGTAGFCSGSKGLYIGTAATNNNYEIGSLFSDRKATNHAYKDYTVTSYCSASLSFNWKNNGNASAALTVWLIPTTVVPVAGTALTASATQIALGGPYIDGMSCSSVNIDLTAYAGQTVRIVFSWKNTGGAFAPAVENSAAMIDDVIFTESSTYNYSWTSNPAGYSASTLNATATPTVETTYSLTVTRCDGCPVTESIIVTDCTVLPLEFNYFEGIGKRDFNLLYWSTLSEINNDYFSLERSVDGYNWTKISDINGSGNSTETLFYEFEDENFVRNSINYYRLNQTDYNGQKNYIGNIVAIDNRIQARLILKKTNILGQEIGEGQKGLVIYYFSDGSIEKFYLD